MAGNRLFPAVIGGDFTPGLGLPFQHPVGVGVLHQPILRPGDQLEDRGVSIVLKEFGLALLDLHPLDGDGRIGVNGVVPAAFFAFRQRVDDGQELANVVGAIFEGPLAEQFLARGGVHAVVFHRPGVADRRGIHAVAVGDWAAKGAQGSLVRLGSPLSFIVRVGGLQGRFGSRAGVEGLIFGALEAVHLRGAFPPGGEDPGFPALPDHVVTGFWHQVFISGEDLFAKSDNRSRTQANASPGVPIRSPLRRETSGSSIKWRVFSVTRKFTWASTTETRIGTSAGWVIQSMWSNISSMDGSRKMRMFV